MLIRVNKLFKRVNPFVLENVPGFIVLTGENGSGKTQFLELLYASSLIDESGDQSGLTEDLANAELYDINLMCRNTDPETGEEMFSLPAEINNNGHRLRDVVYRPVVTPYINVGEGFDLERIYMEATDFAQKHLFVHNYRLDGRDISKVTSEYNRTIKVQKPTGFQAREFKIPEITKKDIELIDRVEKTYPLDFEKDRYYYISLLDPPQSHLFSANLRYLFYQYWAREKAGLEPTCKPWVELNEIGTKLGFKFEIDEPRLSERRFDVRLRDTKKGIFISPNSLSSGEKVFFSLFIALFSTKTTQFRPEAIFFDEPDAYLHPSLTETMLKILNEVFVQRYGIMVIISTHSPSTVALSPEHSLYSMDSSTGIMKKVSKKEAIRSLTEGLNTLSINYENIKQVFVEAKNDALVLNNIFNIAIQKGWLGSKEIQLFFLNVGDDSTDGGCSKVEDIVERLRKAGNQTVYGIIDSDNKNKPKDRIKVLGKGNRYAIDNYVMDPIAVAILFLNEGEEKKKIGFSQADSIVSFSSKTVTEIQSIINCIVSDLQEHLKVTERLDCTKKKYSLVDGRVFELPQWFLQIRGHDLVRLYRETYSFLNRYRSDKCLYEKIIDISYSNYPGIIPRDMIDSLIELQSE